LGNLLKMDLYRMRKATAFRVTLIMALVLSLASTPFNRLFTLLGELLTGSSIPFPPEQNLSDMLRGPFMMLNAMLVMLSACVFFYADLQSGYIKNIAGQMPKKSFTVLSKFIAIIPHNLLFMLAGVLGNILGTVFLQRIVFDDGILAALGVFMLKLLLMQAVCTVLLFVTTALGSQPLGIVLSVLFGTGLLSLVYLAISSGVSSLFKLHGFDLSRYMPDQLLQADRPDTLISIIASAITIGLFLPLGLHIFDKKDT